MIEEQQQEELAEPSGTSTMREGGTEGLSERLMALTERTGYSLVQRNGQRIYGGPPPLHNGQDHDDFPDPNNAPAQGSEVFVGKVPRDCFEDELVPFFEKVGRIYELRLMMDFNEQNRGYLFVRFFTPEEARRAVKTLDNAEIRKGRRIGVMLSVDNRKLWICGLPKNATTEDIEREMRGVTEGVERVILYPCQSDKSKMRGYAFVEYESHRAAALARRKLIGCEKKLSVLGHPIDRVDWAEPENEIDDEVMKSVKVLFVRNLMAETSEKKLTQIFGDLANEKEGDGDALIERVRKSKDYAFVHFRSRESAEKALRSTQQESLIIDGARVEVKWSKPVDKFNHQTRKTLTKILSQGSNTQHPLIMTNGRPIPPRRRGAAGIRGLGAPGTPPPRSLMHLSTMHSDVKGLLSLPPGPGGLQPPGSIGQTAMTAAATPSPPFVIPGPLPLPAELLLPPPTLQPWQPPSPAFYMERMQQWQLAAAANALSVQGLFQPAELFGSFSNQAMDSNDDNSQGSSMSSNSPSPPNNMHTMNQMTNAMSNLSLVHNHQHEHFMTPQMI